MSRTLLIKFGAIGDVVMAITAAWQLHLAGHTVDWVCGPTVLPVLELYPWINPVLADDRAILTGSAPQRAMAIAKLWSRLAGRRYDLAATLYYDSRYRLLALPVRATRKLQLSHTDRNLRLIPGRHHTDEYARILLGREDSVEPLALAPISPVALPKSPLPAIQDGRSRIVIVPAGASNLMNAAVLRRWPVERYVELAQHLLGRGCEVVLIGGPDDTWARTHFAGLDVVDRIGELSLPQTIALIDSSDVLVSHDTGPLHLGNITRAGIVALFGPTDPHVFGPRRAGTISIWGGEGFACRPCYDGRSFAPCRSNDCIRQIGTAMVLSEVEHMLAQRARGELPASSVLTPASTLGEQTLVTLRGAGRE